MNCIQLRKKKSIAIFTSLDLAFRNELVNDSTLHDLNLKEVLTVSQKKEMIFTPKLYLKKHLRLFMHSM